MHPVAFIEGIYAARQVGDLPSGAMCAAHELVLDDHTHADAGTDGDERERGDPPRHAGPALPDGREIDVVLDEHRHAEALADGRHGVEVAARAEVVRERCHAATRLIDDPGGRDGDRQRPLVLQARVAHNVANHCRDLLGGAARTALRGRLVLLADQLAEDVGGADTDVRSADIDADDEARAIADDVGHGLAPAPPIPGSARVYEPGLLEAADDRRDRGAREARARRQLRTGDRTLAEDRLEHGLLVQLA